MVGPGRAAHAPLSRLRSVLVELVVVLGGITAYFGIRGLTHEDPQAAIEHAHDIVRLEQALGLDLEQALQVWVLDADPVVHGRQLGLHLGHWPVIAATFVYLALHHRTIYLRLRNAMMISGGLGLCVYTTYPVARPGWRTSTWSTRSSSSQRLPRPAAARPSSTSTPRCRACTSAGTCWSAGARRRGGTVGCARSAGHAGCSWRSRPSPPPTTTCSTCWAASPSPWSAGRGAA
jgi:hypothetical protein